MERPQVDRPETPVLGGEQSGDQIAGEDEEHDDPEVATRDIVRLVVEADHDKHRESTDTIKLRPVGPSCRSSSAVSGRENPSVGRGARHQATVIEGPPAVRLSSTRIEFCDDR